MANHIANIVEMGYGLKLSFSQDGQSFVSLTFSLSLYIFFLSASSRSEFRIFWLSELEVGWGRGNKQIKNSYEAEHDSPAVLLWRSVSSRIGCIGGSGTIHSFRKNSFASKHDTGTAAC